MYKPHVAAWRLIRSGLLTPTIGHTLTLTQVRGCNGGNRAAKEDGGEQRR